MNANSKEREREKKRSSGHTSANPIFNVTLQFVYVCVYARIVLFYHRHTHWLPFFDVMFHYPTTDDDGDRNVSELDMLFGDRYPKKGRERELGYDLACGPVQHRENDKTTINIYVCVCIRSLLSSWQPSFWVYARKKIIIKTCLSEWTNIHCKTDQE